MEAALSCSTIAAVDEGEFIRVAPRTAPAA
jgi:hypothetical protein